jgi:mitochondrial fission process protein 1
LIIMTEGGKQPITMISNEDKLVLMKAYDKNQDNIMSANEILEMVSDFNLGKITNKAVRAVLEKYDTDQDGKFDSAERMQLVSHLHEKKQVTLMTKEDRKVLMQAYDKNNDNILSVEEILNIVSDFNEKKVTNPLVLAVLNKYDTNQDGKFDAGEELELGYELHLGDTTARYGGYTGAAGGIFRYLAFTSDFGEALRPVAKASIVTGSYVLSFGYCAADIAFEAYKLHGRGYVSEKGEPMTMAQCVVERTVFQGVASIAVPYAIIHSAVDVSRRVFARVGRFTKWGPSVVGLSFIPLLPMYLDHPVEHALEWTFQRFGPWAKSKGKQA